MQLGHLWDADLSTHRPVIQEALTMAQGEMALEVFLKQVRRKAIYTAEEGHAQSFLTSIFIYLSRSASIG